VDVLSGSNSATKSCETGGRVSTDSQDEVMETCESTLSFLDWRGVGTGFLAPLLFPF